MKLNETVMPQTKPIVSIENVVASATVDQKMDLNKITKNFPDVEYHPDQFLHQVKWFALEQSLNKCQEMQ